MSDLPAPSAPPPGPPSPAATARRDALRALSAHRWRVGLALTAVMTAIYFGFMLLVAYRKDWLAGRVADGLSWGILLGAGVIVAAWLLTFVYVRWANTYDRKLEALPRGDA